MPHIPFFKGINSKVSSAALRYHIKAALNKSASVQDFKIQLNHLVQRQDFDNATKALIREIEGGLPPDDPPPSGGGGGGIPSPKDTPISGGGNKPPKGNDEHTSKEGDGELISKTTPTRKATKEDLTEEFLEEVKRRKNDKVWIGELTNPQIIEHLGFDPNKPIKMLFDGDALTHIEKRHGEGSPLVESSGQPAVKLEDIQNYPDIVNHADKIEIQKYKDITTLLAGKQINGYVVVIEIVSKKNNALNLKTMYKENGLLEKNRDFSGAGIRLSKDSGNAPEINPSTPLDATGSKSNPTTPELKNQASQWDLNNPKYSDVLGLGTLKNPELDTLKALFDAPNLERQIRAPELKNAMDNGFSLEEVLNYTSHLPTAKRTIFGDELHYSKPLENGKTLHISETYKEPHTLQFSHMRIVEDLKVPPSKIEPNPAFGEHFAEFEGKGAQAVAKLLQEKRGQVAGAFYREDLGESGGYIDLVWGASATDLKGLKGANGKPLKPYGLSKIVEKHLDDFSPFEGHTPLEKLGNGIEAIINNGNLVNDQAGVKTFIVKDNDREFRVGISQGWEHEGKNYHSRR
ncbi:PBECR3 domain-containing polyvalent protein, partial [Helicobacter bizzozeronii]